MERDVPSIHACELPDHALLRRYRRAGSYADCYSARVPTRAAHAAYVEAFYTTWLFKLERRLLARLVARPSTDAQARELARGERTSFAAWDVEATAPDQLLLTDFRGRTRSWLMSEPDGDGTRLYFGSAVVAAVERRTGERRLAFAHRVLLGFHRLYSRLLLDAAARRVGRRLGRAS
jgi:hypothetical protein